MPICIAFTAVLASAGVIIGLTHPIGRDERTYEQRYPLSRIGREAAAATNAQKEP